MVRISEKAAKELKDMPIISKDKHVLRMFLTETQYQGRHKFVVVIMKEARPGDTVIKSKGIKVAYDPIFEASLKDLVIDMAPSEQSEEGERFCVWNPTLRHETAANLTQMLEAQHTAPVQVYTSPEQTVKQ